MSGEDLDDAAPNKNFRLVQIADDEVLDFISYAPPLSITLDDNGVPFPRPVTPAAIAAVITRRDGSSEEFELRGNAYVMNAQGKTIASRCAY